MIDNKVCLTHKIFLPQLLRDVALWPITDNYRETVMFSGWSHIKNSDPASYHYKALAFQELNIERCPLSQFVLMLADLSPCDITQLCTTQNIRLNKITNKEKEKYVTYWNDVTQSQHKLETYVTLNKQYTEASTVTDQNLRTMDRLSDHSLEIEKGRHRHTWLQTDDRLCCHCNEGAVQTELHFLTQ